MWLLRQLFTTEYQQLGHFVGFVPRVTEPIGLYHDFSDVPLIRHHHCYRSETDLQVVRQLIPTRLAWVHGDIDPHGLPVHNLHTLECLVKLVFIGVLQTFVFNLCHHLCDDGEHVEADAVELVEAGPAALVGQAAAEGDDHLGFDGRAAVEHHAEDGQAFRQVFGRLRFAGARGSGRCCAKSECQCARYCVPASFGERSDDQTA